MIKKALEKLKIEALNEMQHASLNTEEGRDVILLSPTGSGKTLGFLLPLLNKLDPGVSDIQVLIIVPSRELALQIEQVFKALGTGFKVSCTYGGHSTKTEKNSLSYPPAVLVGTPGRLAYHLRHKSFRIQSIHTLVLDEFDKALEFGFQADMAFIINQLTGLRKRILTSATAMKAIPPFTGIRDAVVVDFLKDTVSTPNLKLKSVFSHPEDKLETLFKLICSIGNKTTLVFCNHRDAVERISELLWDKGLEHDLFHGGMEQEDREKALLKFRNGTHRLLITTDLASRGLDIPEIECILHYQLPPSEEAFLHRNGRTARMHATGTAYLLLTSDEHVPYLPQDIKPEDLPTDQVLPEKTQWATLYVAAGKKDKINKIDIVGLLLQKGGLQKEDVGLIEVHDRASYAAVKRSLIESVVRRVKTEKIKNRKFKIDVAR